MLLCNTCLCQNSHLYHIKGAADKLHMSSFFPLWDWVVRAVICWLYYYCSSRSNTEKTQLTYSAFLLLLLVLIDPYTKNSILFWLFTRVLIFFVLTLIFTYKKFTYRSSYCIFWPCTLFITVRLSKRAKMLVSLLGTVQRIIYKKNKLINLKLITD